MVINDEYILEKFWKKKQSVFNRYLSAGKVTQEELDYLDNRFSDSICREETLYRIKYDIEERPVCSLCGNSVKWNNYTKYTKFCSTTCVNREETRRSNITKSLKEKYAPFKKVKEESNLTKSEKAKQTFLSKYGVISPFLIPEVREKAMKNSHTPEARTKAKQTTFNRYGVNGWLELKWIQDKAHCKESREKAKQTMLKKYGVESNFDIPEIRNKGQIAAHTPEIEQKRIATNIQKYGKGSNSEAMKSTWLKKYGVEHPRLLTESKEHMSKVMSSKEIQEKRNATLKRNKTFNTSKPEDNINILLKSKFYNVIHHYTSELYPYECDFYIPELNLYIELHFHWTHGLHPFNKNSQTDIDKLNYWKSKNTKYYDQAIKTWIIRDVNKRETAKKNNLNFLEFFTLEEFNKWFEEQ